LWTYLNTPFLLASPGIDAEELEPWKEKAETWRRPLIAGIGQKQGIQRVDQPY
jgi:hypothetical protein